MNVLTIKNGMLVLLIISFLLLLWGLLRRNKLISSAIDLDDLLLGDDGKLSKAAAVMLGAFLLTSWGMLYMWLNKTMTEGFFMAYLGAWVAPTVTKLIVNRPPTASAETTIISKTVQSPTSP